MSNTQDLHVINVFYAGIVLTKVIYGLPR